jgi:hypothetical protein
MPYQILFNEEDGIVQVIYSGTAIKDDHYAALNEAIKLCDEKKTSRLLVDFSDQTSSNLSTMDCYAFGETVARIKQRICIAHVLSRNPEVRQNILFASDIEVNRGKMTREFDKVEDAKAWLRSIP